MDCIWSCKTILPSNAIAILVCVNTCYDFCIVNKWPKFSEWISIVKQHMTVYICLYSAALKETCLQECYGLLSVPSLA